MLEEESISKCKADIKADEGFSLDVYADHGGVLTVGWGHTGQGLRAGQHYSKWQCESLFEVDFKIAAQNFESLDLEMDDVRACVIINMLFNLGLTRFMTFKKMLGHLKAKDYVMAAVEGLDSKWRRDVKGRSHRLMAELITGVRV